MTRTHILSAFVAGASIILVGGCGGGGSTPRVATATGTHTSTTVGRASETQVLHAAAQCIRDHGVPDFPDPTIDAGGQVQYDKQLLDSQPPAVSQQVQQVCQSQINAAQQYVDPQGQSSQNATPAELAAETKFAQCVRQHGYPNFPDPAPTGGFQFTPGGPTPPAKGSPAFEACRGLLGTGS